MTRMRVRNLVERLRTVVGRERVIVDRVDLFSYSYDASFISAAEGQPAVVVMPQSTKEVSEILRLANEYRFPVIPRGAGSNVSGGCISVPDSIILVMTRLNRILEIDRENHVGIVEAGVITAAFQAEVEKLGLFYPPDPSSQEFSTIGGNVAECAGGPRGLKYGVTRDYVLGLEVVLADGSVLNTGARTMKSVAGYDLTRLFTGSEGTLGVITKVIVKLLPLPEDKRTMLVVFKDITAAARAVSGIISRGIIPATIELLDDFYVRNIEEYARIGLPIDAEAVLLIEVDGEAASLGRQVEFIERAVLMEGATEFKVAATQEEAGQLWKARRAAFAAVARLKPTIVGEDVTVPRTAIPEMIRSIREIGRRHQIPMATLAHAGDGNLHVAILADERVKTEMDSTERAVEELCARALQLGGTITGEHGIGTVKSRFLRSEVGDIGIQVMKKIKHALDPNGILNPGKVIE